MWLAIAHRRGNGTGHKGVVTLMVEGGEGDALGTIGDDHEAPGLQVAPVGRLLGGGETLFDDFALDRLAEIETFPHSTGGGEHIFDAQMTIHGRPPRLLSRRSSDSAPSGHTPSDSSAAAR